MKLNGNTILITGDSTGIGFEFASAFVALKNTVIITGRDVAKLAKAQAQVPELKTIRSDVSRVEDINALYVEVTPFNTMTCGHSRFDIFETNFCKY